MWYFLIDGKCCKQKLTLRVSKVRIFVQSSGSLLWDEEAVTIGVL